jgi:hypothetical protein
MKGYLLKKIICFIIFVVAVLLCEVITFHALGFGFFPTFFLFPLALTLIIASVIFIIPGNIIPTILYSLVLLFMCLLSITNIVLFRVHGDLFTIDLLSLVSEARAAMDGGFVVDFAISIPFIALLVVATVWQITIVRLVRENSKQKKSTYRRHGALVLACVATLMGGAAFLTSVLQVNNLSRSADGEVFGISTRENFDDLKFKVPFFRDFGSLALVYRNMIMQTQPGAGIIPSRTIDDSKNYFAGEGDFEDFEGCFFGVACIDGDGCIDPLHWAPDEGNNVIVLLLESFEDFMIHPTFTPALYNLRERSINFNNFHGNHKTDFSESAVILGSYPMHINIVSGWTRDNAGDTRNPNLTREFPFSLPNVLLGNGFGSANYFLNHDGFNYARTYTHPTFGFDGAFFTESFPLGPVHQPNTNWKLVEDGPAWGESVTDPTRRWRNDWSWFTPEAEYLYHAIAGGSFLPEGDEPFLTFFSTINAHGGYQARDNMHEIYYQNLAWIEEYEDIYFDYLKPPFGRFNARQFGHFKMAMSRAMVADQGIAFLLHELESRSDRAGTLCTASCELGDCVYKPDAFCRTMADETTILAFSDHNAYMNDLSFTYKQTGRHTSPAHNIPAFLFSPQLWSAFEDGLMDTQEHLFGQDHFIEVDKFMMHFDLVPTLFNVLGIEVNQRMYLGFHAFDERENIVITRLGPASVFNDLFATDGIRVLWRSKCSTAEDLVLFRERYLCMINRWSHINNLYSPNFQHNST